jgi:hypothetical protein
MLSLAHDISGHKVSRLTVPNHLRTTNAAEGPQGRHQIDRLERVRLSLGIISQQKLKAWWNIHVQPRIIAEIAKPKMSYMHNTQHETRACPPRAFSSRHTASVQGVMAASN